MTDARPSFHHVQDWRERWLPTFGFVWIGFYSDLPIPFSSRKIVFDAGWRWHYDGERYGIWLVGWRYA